MGNAYDFAEKLYIDVHVVQTLPPSCVNRDDIGSPKKARYGGVDRARISSQCWKHAIRLYWNEKYGKEWGLGYRTGKVVDKIAEKILELDPDFSDARVKAAKAFGSIGKPKKADGKKETEEGESSEKEVLFFISREQIESVAKAIIEQEKTEKEMNEQGKNKQEKDKQEKEYIKKLKNCFNEDNSVDIALFGRMFAGDADFNVDAACQVAHVISTHAVSNEDDYFTALDDVKVENGVQGAGHIDTKEFNSSTVYRFATLNVRELISNYSGCGGDPASVVAAFVDAFVRSMPSGSINSYANYTLPGMVYVAVRTDQPINLSNAFESPVKKGDNGFEKSSIKALIDKAEEIYEDYSCAPVKAFLVGRIAQETSPEGFAENCNYPQIIEKVKESVQEIL